MKTGKDIRSKEPFCLLCLLPASLAVGQQRASILAGSDLSRVWPQGFYFQGLSAPTQTRNSAAARWGKDRHVIAGLVDTSGYSTEVRAKYEGFLITDFDISLAERL